jgi:hypothetical protein
MRKPEPGSFHAERNHVPRLAHPYAEFRRTTPVCEEKVDSRFPLPPPPPKREEAASNIL